MIEERTQKLGYGTNSAEQYSGNRGSSGSGIGWRSGNYRRLIHEHMMQSETGRRYVHGASDEEEDEEDDDVYIEISEDDEEEEDGVEEQSNLSRFLNYIVQRATGGGHPGQAENGLSQAQIQQLLQRIVASAEQGEDDMEMDEDDVEEVVE